MGQNHSKLSCKDREEAVDIPEQYSVVFLWQVWGKRKLKNEKLDLNISLLLRIKGQVSSAKACDNTSNSNSFLSS